MEEAREHGLSRLQAAFGHQFICTVGSGEAADASQIGFSYSRF
jgi:hypothetical protein